MMHLVTGGSGSGKSAFAENLILNFGSGHRYYIATMIPYGAEGKQRVERHRRLRKEKKFDTLECYTNVGSLKLPEDAIVLLECMSNLVANEVFESDGAGENTTEAVISGIENLRAQVSHLVIVTNEIFSDGISYDPDTTRYLSYLGQVNQTLASMADEVTEVVYGIPVKIKGVN